MPKPPSSTVPHLPAPPMHPPGFWQRDPGYPRPLTPFIAGWRLPAHNRSSKLAFTDLSAMIDRIELREIEGYVYRRIVFYGPQQAPPAVLRPFARFFLRVRPATRRRLTGAMRTLRQRRDAESVDRWQQEWQPRLSTEHARLAELSLQPLDDRELDAHADRVLRFAHEGNRLAELVAVSAWLIVGRFVRACAGSLAYDTERSISLVRAGERQAGDVRAARETLREGARAGFDEQLAAARRASIARWDSHRLVVDKLSELSRAVVLEFGRRLAERTQLQAAEDVEFLSFDEARAAMRDRAGRQDMVSERRRAWQDAGTRTPPETFGSRQAQPPLDLYPDEVREMTEAILVGSSQAPTELGAG